MAVRLGICKFCDKEFETGTRGAIPESCPQCRAEDYCQRYYHYIKHPRSLRSNKLFFDNAKQVLQRAKGKCEVCHLEKRLYIHHRDGKGLQACIPNHSIANLIVVCAKCHMKLHGLQKAGEIKEIKEMREKGMTFQSIGDKYGVSRQRAYQLLNQKVFNSPKDIFNGVLTNS